MLEKGGPSPEMIGILINRGKVGPDRPRGRRPPRPARPCHTVTLDPRPPDGATVHLCCFRHPCLRSCVSTAPGNGCRSPHLSSGFCCVITRPQGVGELIIPTPRATGGPGMGDARGTTEHSRAGQGPALWRSGCIWGSFCHHPSLLWENAVGDRNVSKASLP